MARPNRLYSSARKNAAIGKTGLSNALIAKVKIGQIWAGKGEDVRRGRLQLETLERRQLLAGDIELFSTDGVDASAAAAATASSAAETAAASAANPVPAFVTEMTAEGEPAPDLVAYAQLLEQVGARFYGADWCPACRQQKELFGEGSDNLPFVEVTNPDRTINSVGTTNNITQFPTWDFPSGQRLVGVQTLDALATAAGVTIPISDVPTFEPLGDQTVAIGSPLHVVVDAYDPGEGPVTTTVTVADPSLVEATVITGNRSIRIDVENYGVMVFEMFEGRAPRTTGQIIQLVQNGFYDQQAGGDEIIFHRVIDNFVLQAGDPTGTGASGSTLPDVDDEFHPDLQHNREGILSFAKAEDDTNNSQFFITETPTRTLDYNHSVMGQLVEGFDVREAISRVATDASDRPQFPIRISNVTVFEDNENSLVMLKPISGQTGSTTATFTTTDADGNTSSETVDVFVVADTGTTANSQPYLGDIADPSPTVTGQSATLQLTSIDVEGDPVRYSAFDRTTGTNIGVTVDPTTGLLTVTPPSGFVGTAAVEARVEWVTPAFAGQFDSQLVEFDFVASTTADTLVLPTATRAFVGQEYTGDIELSGGDETGVTYLLVNPPTGASIDATTGVLTFTPTASQVGSVAIGVSASRGGNVLDTGTVTLSVATAAAAYTVELTNIDGTAVTTLTPGQEFFATLIAEDQRPFPSNTGVFAAAADLQFDPALVRPVAGGTIEFLEPLDDLNGGTIASSLIDNVKGVSPRTNATQEPVNPFARIRFEAVAAGSATLQTATAADVADTLLFDVNNEIAPTEISYAAATVSIVSDLSVTDDTFTVDEDSAATTLDVLANDNTAATTATLTVRSITQPSAGGTVTLQNGEVRFTPASNFVGTSTFTYTAGTSASDIGVATVTVTVENVNDDPVAVDDTFSVGASQTAQTLDLLANDTFAPDQNETLTITAVGTPTAGGTISIAADNLSVTYTPPASAGSVGSDSFTYTISDGTSTATATATVSLDPVPTAVADTVAATEDTAVTIDPLANDTADTDGQTFTITAVGTPSAGGTATITDNATRIAYTPAADFNGAETLTYTITDTGGGQSTATITMNVAAVNDPPPTGTFDRTVVQLSDQSLEQTVLRLSDLPDNVDDGETLRFSAVSIGNATTGTVRVSPEGTEIIFTPATGINASVTDTISFTVTDSGGLSQTGTIDLRVNDYQLRRVAVNFAGRSAAIGLLDSSPRLEGTAIDGTAVSMAASVGADGSVTFDDLAPGNYEVVVPANPFLQGRDAEQRIAVTSGVDDGDTEVTPQSGLLRPEFISIADFLGSTSRRSVLVAVQPGSDSQLTLGRGTDDVNSVTGSLDSDGGQLTLRGNDPAATTDAARALSVTLPTAGDSRVQTRGRVGDLSLYRINLDAADTMFSPANSAGTSAAGTSAAGTSAAGTSAAGTSAAGSGGSGDTGGTNNLDDLLSAMSGDGTSTGGADVNDTVNDAAIAAAFGDG